jgi:hypothetical protein
MPFRYLIDSDRRIVFSTYSGRLTDTDIIGHADCLRADPLFQPHFRQLTDTRDVVAVDVTPHGIRRIAKSNPFAASARRALITDSRFIYGLTRMYETLIGIQPCSNEDQTLVSTDLGEARDWLGLD